MTSMTSMNNNLDDENKISSVSPALQQGSKYKKIKKEVIKGLEPELKELEDDEVEGFDTLIPASENIVSANKYSNTQKERLANLQRQYDDTLREYNNLVAKIVDNTDKYVNRVNPGNPYLNKVLRFPTRQLCYVTNQGVAKHIPSTDILNSTNISMNGAVDLNIPWDSKYLVPGTAIPTNPPLIAGTAVKQGQLFGNEGSNVYAIDYIPRDTSANYMGCYATSPNNDNMTFIGPVPPRDVIIVNGDFSLPPMRNNTFRFFYGNSSEVPGWVIRDCAFLNNSLVWGLPTPYPKGDQCVGIKRGGFMYTILQLSSGVEYTLSFYACGRGCCGGEPIREANPIQIKLHTAEDAFISNVYQVSPPIRRWTKYTTKFTVPTTRSYRLYFAGMNPAFDRTSGVQGITITDNVTREGNYNLAQCMAEASRQGYQYFALQGVNSQTSRGYCAVSNSSPEITRFGIARVPSNMITLWSSNTAGKQGSTCTLSNTGALQVIDSTGKVIYATPSANAVPANYLGCYVDNATTRTMAIYDGGKQEYNANTCGKVAKRTGNSLFGLQNSTTGKKAQCTFSNNIDYATQFGIATNCSTGRDGTISGGALSNAIYNANAETSNYYLLLKDDGSMVINRGQNLDDNQGEIWNANTRGKQLEANPSMAASQGKYGRNWIRSGDTLAAGDFVSSPNGKISLMMKPDGNLVLVTFQMEENCRTMQDGRKGGGTKANAAYNIGVASIPANLGKLGYLDGNSDLYFYPNTNQTYSNEYTVVNMLNTAGNDLTNASIANATVESCKTACNRRNDCAGFVFNRANNVCYPKNRQMYPYGTSFSSNQSTDIYVRNINPATVPKGVSSNTVNIDTVSFSKYNRGGNIGAAYGLANANVAEKQQLQLLQSRLDMLTQQINAYTGEFNMGSQQINNQSTINTDGVRGYLSDINITNTKIQDIGNKQNPSLQNILNDTDIVVLQRNYEYLFWSILAAGSVLITMNIVRK